MNIQILLVALSGVTLSFSMNSTRIYHKLGQLQVGDRIEVNYQEYGTMFDTKKGHTNLISESWKPAIYKGYDSQGRENYISVTYDDTPGQTLDALLDYVRLPQEEKPDWQIRKAEESRAEQIRKAIVYLYPSRPEKLISQPIIESKVKSETARKAEAARKHKEGPKILRDRIDWFKESEKDFGDRTRAARVHKKEMEAQWNRKLAALAEQIRKANEAWRRVPKNVRAEQVRKAEEEARAEQVRKAKQVRRKAEDLSELAQQQDVPPHPEMRYRPEANTSAEQVRKAEEASAEQVRKARKAEEEARAEQIRKAKQVEEARLLRKAELARKAEEARLRKADKEGTKLPGVEVTGAGLAQANGWYRRREASEGPPRWWAGRDQWVQHMGGRPWYEKDDGCSIRRGSASVDSEWVCCNPDGGLSYYVKSGAVLPPTAGWKTYRYLLKSTARYGVHLKSTARYAPAPTLRVVS